MDVFSENLGFFLMLQIRSKELQLQLSILPIFRTLAVKNPSKISGHFRVHCVKRLLLSMEFSKLTATYWRTGLTPDILEQ